MAVLDEIDEGEKRVVLHGKREGHLRNSLRFIEGAASPQGAVPPAALDEIIEGISTL